MERILVGFDGSEQARRALTQASTLARHFRCPLTVLTAAVDRLVREDGVVTMAADEGAGLAVAKSGAELARSHGVTGVETRVSVEAPDEALVHEAANGYDLIVVGHRAHGIFEEMFLGSTAKQVVDRAKCSVLIVR